jgi:hypothetical protein
VTASPPANRSVMIPATREDRRRAVKVRTWLGRVLIINPGKCWVRPIRSALRPFLPFGSMFQVPERCRSRADDVVKWAI